MQIPRPPHGWKGLRTSKIFKAGTYVARISSHLQGFLTRDLSNPLQMCSFIIARSRYHCAFLRSSSSLPLCLALVTYLITLPK